jgi:hypothetical protein
MRDNMLYQIAGQTPGTQILLILWLLWRPRFLISVIDANDRISPTQPADFGQT